MKSGEKDDIHKWAKYKNEAFDLYRKLQLNGSLDKKDKKRLESLENDGFFTHTDVGNYLRTGVFYDSEKAKKKKEDIKYYIFLSLLGIFIIFVIANNLGLGEARPGSFLEKKAYSTKLFVNVFPGSSEAKNYRLQASIRREEDSDGYFIDKIYWPNGGYTEFEDDECRARYNEKSQKYIAYCVNSINIGSDSEKEVEYTIEITDELVK